MRVGEIYPSIQGEGPHAGRNAVFLRLSGCNLGCPDCDSSFTWEEGKEMNTGEVLDTLRPLLRNRGLVITGGEPLLQRDEVELLAWKLQTIPFIDIETNGTQKPLAYNTPNITYIISPKLGSLGRKVEYLLDVISSFFSRNYAFKFVVGCEDDFREVEKFVEQYHIRPERVWLMPKGTHFDSYLWQAVWTYACAKGYNFSPRLHILLWGGRRGV